MSLRLGILASHPIQYQAPLFRELAKRVDLEVHFAFRQTVAGQAAAGFGTGFEWDVDLLSEYRYRFLNNIARHPTVSRFSGCDTPEIANIIRHDRFDAFLVMGWYLKSYCQAIWACKQTHVPVLVRGDSRLGSRRGRLKTAMKAIGYPLLMRQFDACLYVGQDNRDYLEHYGVPIERLFFSPHCVDTRWFSARSTAIEKPEAKQRLGLDTDEKIVLFVGKLLAIKRPLDVVRAVALLRDGGSKLRILVAGDGPLRKDMEELGRRERIPITVLGFQNQTELPLIYRAADLMVLPSESETWGLVVNEALACNVPVVVSDAVGSARDLVDDVRIGRVYPMGNLPALADALQKTLVSSTDLNTIANKLEQYSMAVAADGVVRAIEWLHPDNSSRLVKEET